MTLTSSDAPSVGGLTPTEALRAASDYLKRRWVEAPGRTAELLLMDSLNSSRSDLYIRRGRLTRSEAHRFTEALERRAAGVPLQYVTRRQQFMDLELETAPGVFIPRPETEMLVEAALDALRDRGAPIVVDVGTGTGAVALAIKRHVPAASVHATDVSEAAVDLATMNARQLGLGIAIARGDLLHPISPDLRGRIDLVVSNPPYVTPDEYESLPSDVKAEPQEALVGGTEVIARLAAEASEWLAPGGWLLTEIGATQGREVAEILTYHLSSVEVLQDLAGRDRVARGKKTPR